MNILPELGEYKIVIEDSDNFEFPDCILECCFLKDVLHSRGDAPSFIARNKLTGEVVGSIWHKNGVEHRDYDLPADIREDAKYTSLSWYTNGKNTKSFTISKLTGHTVCKLFYADAPKDAPSDDYLCTAYHYDEETGDLVEKKYHYAQHDLDDPSEMPNLPFPNPDS